MGNHKRADLSTEKQKKQIIKVGKANDNMNKYCIKISAPPVCVGVVLIVLSNFLAGDTSKFVLLGMAFLFVGFAIPLVWASSIAIRAKICKYYSYELYEELLEKNTESEDFEPDAELYPRTTKLAIEMFEGDIKSAIEYVMCHVRGDELSEYIAEWSPEQGAYAIESVYGLGKEKLGEKELENIVKEAATLSDSSEVTDVGSEIPVEQKNPYLKKLVIHSIALIILIVSIVLLNVALANFNFLDNTICLLILVVVFTSETSEVGLLIVKAIKFKLWKKKQQNK